MLSKSDYKKYLECPFYLWLHKYRPDLLPEELVVISGKSIDEGKQIDDLSRGLFKNTFEVKGFGIEGWGATKRAMDAGKKILIQPTVVADLITSRADLLVYNSELNKWDIFEVKSTTSVKRGGKSVRHKSHIIDLVFQRICWERAGISIGRTCVIYVNSDFIRNGEVLPGFRDLSDPSKGFFIQEDITDEVHKMAPEVESGIDIALAILKIDKDIDPKIVLAKSNSKDDFKFLSQLDQKVLDLLEVEIPEEDGEDICDKESIKRELNSFQYPLYYFDYETFNPAVPLFDGLHPYQQMPFQYSLHIQKTPEASVEHKYFLATEKVNSIPDLLAQLQRDLGDKGTILVWYQAFEKGRNEEMAKMYPEYAGFIRSVNDERIYDLMSIFKSSLFRKKEFGKSSSLKVVAPVLVPELPYTELNIQEGGKASESWLELVDGNLSQVEKDDLYDDMLKYCERDTEVMVRILKFLIKITKISF